MPRTRVGVVLPVPEPVATEIDGLRRALGDGALGRIAPHLTLVPPVNVPVEEMDLATEVLRAAAGVNGPLVVQLGPPTTFWPVTPVVFLGVSDAEGVGPGETERLHRLRRSVFRGPLERTLTHDFVPHVTLADELAEARIAPAVAALSDFWRTVRFDRVALLQEGVGRRWSPLFEVSLGAGSVVGRGGLPLELTLSTAPDPAARQRLRAPASFALTATREASVVGVAECRLDGRDAGTAHLVELLVSPSERMTGVGAHLLAACLARAVQDLAAQRLISSAQPGGPLGRFLVHKGFRRHPDGLERKIR